MGKQRTAEDLAGRLGIIKPVPGAPGDDAHRHSGSAESSPKESTEALEDEVEDSRPNAHEESAGREADGRSDDAEDAIPSPLFPKLKNELKSKSLVLKVKPSEHKRWRSGAEANGVTLTVFIETILNDYCDRNGIG